MANSKVVKAASIVAFVIAGLGVIGALMGPIMVLPLAAIPLVAGIGIMRRRVWSAYGFAFYQFAQLLLLPVALFRSTMGLPGIIAAAALIAALIPLFLLAGRSLAAAGAERGWAWPWIAASVLTTLPLFFVQAFVIPTGSMEDTLLIGDRILVQRFPKPSPERGDVIVFVYPIDRDQTQMKRVIGAPGDHIRISEKIVYRNGAALKEPYAVHRTAYVDSYRDNFPSEPNIRLADAAREMIEKHVVNGELVVPGGKYFVLGDNRDNSFDSRYWGFVSSADLIGKPLVIYESEDQTEQGRPGGKPVWVWAHGVRWNRFLKVL
ncbi:MAG TPA: signal peptidase I [Candidatus Acidoferrales bacterium]|jgi:signal peptidase I|nr:signal peptidase I [Candidatus Acidoferrales bacterium]